MDRSIVINKQHLTIKQYKGKRVVTFKDIDLVHGRPEGTAHRNFKANRNHFIEGVDYFRRNSSEAKKEFGISAPNGLILITESGYLMLAKSFTDDLAWNIQRALVNFYFKENNTPKKEIKEKSQQLALETKEYYYFDKTYKGQPVLSTKDIEHFTGISVGTLNYHLRKSDFILGVDYFRLEYLSLREFKAENPNVRKSVGGPYNIVTKSGFVKLIKSLNETIQMPKCFENSKIQEKTDFTSELKKLSKGDYITAINVLRAAIYGAKGFKAEWEEKKEGSLNMAEYYQKDINACNLVIEKLCSYLSAGYGTDF